MGGLFDITYTGTYIINTVMNKLHAGDILITLPFAYVISQSLLTFNIFWFFGALWIFDAYAYMRRKQNV